MTYRDLPKYLQALEARHLIDTIEVEVDPELEITEIADRVSKQYGKALKFTNVKGSPFPLVINTMGTYERLNLGLGVCSLDEIAAQIEDYMDLSAYVTLKGKIKSIPKLAPLPFIFPRKVKHAPCQEVVEEPNLNLLPIIKCWPQDGGKYITLPLVFTKDPETGQQNVGMYRLQVYDEKTTGMHWHLHKDGKVIYEKYRRLGKKMPVSVAIGCDPATLYAATAPLPKMIDEMIFAGYLKRKSVELVRCLTNDILVPAHAEFILEGYVDLEERRREGPFGDHTGYYSLSDDYPVFHIEKMTRKQNPIYPTTIVGKPPMEDCYLGKATERIFLPLMKIQCPELVDLDFPLEGVFHNCAIVSIKKAFPLHGNKVLYALWGMGQMMYTKMIIVVDETVDVHDYKAVVMAMAHQVTRTNHLVISEGPLDALDHASNRAFQGFRLGIDATQKLPLEQSDGKFNQMDFEFIMSNCVEILPFSKDKGLKAQAYLSSKSKDLNSKPVVILIDEWIDPTDYSTVSWKIFNNIDPMRDLICIEKTDGTLFVGLDATKKGPEDGLMRPWPDDIEMSAEIVEKVNRRWSEYGFK
ncbi:menaquinone biosynthesis decarboxylase [Fusibacter sp. 3D3]|uniref:menaquinone biosynthesis decarboxylase n=1 Tax=Fusibacter sp. 3D3 TaxID=1048380 RepID=UPI000852D8D0|nr:menaquinone biosynthesis decarboxylase [Fusibacter sp. 3D3]GAU78525.1 UbiD family decarboxylase associated with menaquinone via futalosine [Fusibacter sp. 3D3]